ncbi:MAG: 6-phosphofructokinase [Phycisphaerae bacterium]
MKPAAMGIVVGGRPAPGINSVIGAATIEAVNNGLSVLGILDGFRHLAGEFLAPEQHVRPLTIKDVGRIHFDGGSILRTSRTSLLDQSKLAVSPVVEPDVETTGRVCHRW